MGCVPVREFTDANALRHHYGEVRIRLGFGRSEARAIIPAERVAEPVQPAPEPPVMTIEDRLAALSVSTMATGMMCSSETLFSPSRPTMKYILEAVARAYDVPVVRIKSSYRTADVIWPRQVACWLARELSMMSYPEIGRKIGGRDHTTILHSWRKVEAEIASEGERAPHVKRLRDTIEAAWMLRTGGAA